MLSVCLLHANHLVQFSSVAQSHPTLCSPWTTARQASLCITNSQSSPKPMSFELVMPSNHLIICRPLILLPSIFPSITVFSNESALHIRWPEDWSFSFKINPSNEYSGLISFRMDWLQILAGSETGKYCPLKSPMPYFILVLKKGYFLNVFIDSI